MPPKRVERLLDGLPLADRAPGVHVIFQVVVQGCAQELELGQWDGALAGLKGRQTGRRQADALAQLPQAQPGLGAMRLQHGPDEVLPQ